MSIEKAIEILTIQQGTNKDSNIYWVGEQLKDIAINVQGAADLLCEDLIQEKMSVSDAEKRIAEYAKKNKSGNSGCCSPIASDKILREMYGIGEGAIMQNSSQKRRAISLTDFM